MKNKKIIIISVFIVLIILLIFLKNNNNDEYFQQIAFNEIINNDVKEKNKIEEQKIKVHIIGEVNNPGLIELKVGERIADAIELAGGLTELADISKTNLAYVLSDGEKIYIPNISDEDDVIENNTSNSNNKININTATVNELQKIPGVGESTASSILEYRNKNRKIC